MSEKTLKFGNVEVNNKKCHASKQLIALILVDINQIVTPNQIKLVIEVLNIFLAMEMMLLLDLYVLFCLK